MDNPAKIQGIGVWGLITDKKQRILLVQRHQPDDPKWDGLWNLPGGGVLFGETPQKALKREIKEEVGIDTKAISDEPFVNSYFGLFGRKHIHAILLCYPCKVINKPVIKINNEIKSFKWIKSKDIDYKNCVPLTDYFINKFEKRYQKS